MVKKRERIIFDDDATQVIATDNDVDLSYTPKHPQKNSRLATNKEPLAVVDVFDTIAGYIMPTFYMIHDSEKSGTCLLCGKKTAYEMRKLCIDCMQQHSREIYEKARIAIENGETTIEL